MSIIEYGELLSQTVLQENIRKDYLARFITYKNIHPEDIRKLVTIEGNIYTKHIREIRKANQ